MKKNLFKKSMSVFLTALMLLSCWVFVPGEHNIEAEAYSVVNPPVMNGNNAYTPSNGLNAYGTPIFDGNHDRWFKWANTSSGDWTTVYYPSHIYLDKTESLQAAGYNFYVEWHFGNNTDYRIILAGPIWGDYYNRDGGYINSSITPSAYPRYFTMTNIFSNYKIDASNPKGFPSGLYGSTSSSTDYDTRIVGYSAYTSSQGTDQYTYNNQYNDKLLFWRSNQATNSSTIYLMGNPSESYVGKTTEYNTSGTSVGNYGLAQNYKSGKWSNHSNGSAQFNSKGSESSYMEGQWIEMAWNVTIYDKSALNSLITSAKNIVNNQSAQYTYASIQNLKAAITTAETQLKVRAQTQTDIDNAKNALQTAINNLATRTYEITYENLFSLSDWYNSESSKYSDSYVTTNLSNGTIKLYKPYGVGEYTTASSYPNSHNANMYSMPVTGGKQYTVEYTSSASTNDTPESEVYLFWYDTNDSYLGLNNKSFTSDGKHSVSFTAPDAATKCEIRFDNNGGNYSTETISNIAFYPVDRANDVELDTWTTRPYRKLYNYGNTFNLSDLTTPVRPGYKFDGWYLDAEYTNPYSNFDGTYTFTAANGAASFPAYAKWSKKTLDINYDNLFSFSDWYYSKSNGVNDSAKGSMTADVEKGTITFTATVNDFFSPNNGAAGYYTATVKPNTTYVLSYDLALTSGGMQVGAWYYTDSLAASSVKSYDISYSEADGYYEFTTPSDCTKVAIRFGVTGDDGKGTYSNIGIYEKADYEDYADSYSKVREPFKVGDTTDLMYPSREGYVFDGWEKADRTKIEDVTGLTASETVYATWVKEWKVTFWLDDLGTKTYVAGVKDGTAAVAPQETPTKAKDENYSYDFSSWDTDFSNVTADMTVKPVFTQKAHTVDYVLVSDSTCEKNAMVDKTCSTCGYVFFYNDEYDGTEIEEYRALGHDFEGQPAVSGTSSNGTHEVRCSRYTSASCGGTTRVAHSFDKTISTEGATCTVKGTVTKSCACGATTQVEGETDPNGHNYDETKGTPNNDNATHTVACTYDPTHTKSVNCKDNDKNCICDICNQELVHSYVNKTKDNVVSEAECEKDAVYYLTCQCGKCSADTWTDTDSALEHDWKDTEKYPKSAANCTDDEVYYKECSLCGISSESKTGATWTKAGTKWNHKFDGDYVTNNDGTHVQKCTNTGCTATGNKQNCTYGEWTKDNAVTHSHTCTACKYTPAAENHSWSKWTTVEGATGTAAATQTRSCDVCGRTETKACTYTSTHADATCTSPERTTYTCTDCGHGYTVNGAPAKGHDFSGEYKYDSSADTHQQLCANNCGTYGIGTEADEWEDCTWTYVNKADGKHTASCVCGNSEEQDCSGGTATCTAPAECQCCNKAYGTTVPHSFKGAAVKLDGDFHAFLCEFCGEETGIKGVGTTVDAKQACSGGTATCSALAVCEICKDTHGAVDTDAHKWITPPVADADNAGKHIYTCEYNNEHKKSEACVSGSSVVVAPKCEEQGYTIQTCKECSYEWKTDYTDATDHNWVNPVCNGNGTHTLTCNNENADGWTCDATLTLNCAESAITFGFEPETCTEQGYTTYQCTVCNYTWNADFVPATGHSYTNKLRSLDEAYKRSDKTCTEAETYWYRCDNCTVSAGTEEDKYADDLASIYWSNGKPLGHDMQKLVDENDLAKNRKSEATCTAAAVYYYSCSVCGEKDETQTFTYKSALGHDYQNIVDADDLAKNRVSVATCTSAAIYYKSCSRCGDVSNDTFEYGEKTGHKMTKTDAVKETCTTDGNVEYYTCSNCGKKFKDEDGTEEISKVVLPALDHDWESVAFKAASCEEEGHSAYKECSRCDVITGKTIYKATGHKFTGAYTFDSAIGYHSRYCVNDNCLADGEKANGMVDAEGNNIKLNITYVDDEAVVVGGEKCEFTSSETDTDENGIHSHKLTCVCGNVTSKAYSDTDTFVETVAPTCTEDGYDAHKCPDCDDTWQKNIVKSEGHDLAETATSNGDGTHSVKCSKCDYEADAEKCSGGTATCKDKAVCSVCKAEYGETTDHTYDETKWVYQNDATCTEDGTEKNNCTVCNEEATRTAEDTATGHDMIADYTYDTSGWKHKPADFDEEIKAPTCKDEGLAIIYCEKCSYYKTKTAKTDSTAHIWSENVTISGNCATGVVETRSCEICGAKKSTPAENQDHTFVLQVSKKATCTERSIEYYICSVCGFDKETRDNEALGHTWADEIVVDKAPTCKNPGRGYKVCTVCQAKSDFEAIAKLPHAWDQDDDGITDEGFAPSADDFGYIYVEATEAACAKDGYAGYFKCLDCSYDQHRDSRWLAVEGNFTPATGHADIDGDGECDGKGCTKDLSDNSNGDCGCICHKDSWFMQIIYKILRFFWKLFKIGKSCDCGYVHY